MKLKLTRKKLKMVREECSEPDPDPPNSFYRNQKLKKLKTQTIKLEMENLSKRVERERAVNVGRIDEAEDAAAAFLEILLKKYGNCSSSGLWSIYLCPKSIITLF